MSLKRHVKLCNTVEPVELLARPIRNNAAVSKRKTFVVACLKFTNIPTTT